MKRLAKVTREKTVDRTAKSDRPGKAVSRAEGRPVRAGAKSISDFRDILGVFNKDPEKRYRWILSTAEMDKRIFDAMRAGWELVDASKEKDLVIGDYAVGKSDNWGAHYRIPAARRSRDEYLYLMWMPEDFAKDVDAHKAKMVNDREKDIMRSRTPEEDEERGQYTEGLEQKVWEEDRVFRGN